MKKTISSRLGRASAPVLYAAALAVMPFASQGAGVSVINLHSFDVFFNGEAPSGSLVQGPNGLLYGTTFEGGGANAGVIFDVSSNGAVNTLYTFTNGVDGAFPQAGLFVANDGNFYGTTVEGGTNGTGALFRMTPAGVFNPLYSFAALPESGQNQDGAYPGDSLMQASDGNLYGTASAGGTNGSGTLFSKISVGGAFQLVYAFNALDANGENSEGSGPQAALIQGADTNLYGTAYGGGSNGFGTVFSYNIAQGQMSSVYSFKNGADGANPMAALVQGRDGYFYGLHLREVPTRMVCYSRFLVRAYLLRYTLLAARPREPIRSRHWCREPTAVFTELAPIRGAGLGPFLKRRLMARSRPSMRLRAEMTAPILRRDWCKRLMACFSERRPAVAQIIWERYSASLPTGPLRLSCHSWGAVMVVIRKHLWCRGRMVIYGTAYSGGAAGDGAIFELTTNGAFTVLYSFTNGQDGGFPVSGLTMGTDGNLYGGSFTGGAHNYGVEFKLTPQGVFTVLYPFTGTSQNHTGAGAHPWGALTQGTNGYFFGTTYEGGYNTLFQVFDPTGSVFEMSPNGAVLSLYTFTNGLDGGYPRAGVIIGSDGALYGTTTSGGNAIAITNFPYRFGLYGTLFKITTNGVLTHLYTFTNGVDGGIPLCKLVQLGDGSFLGTTSTGGVGMHGTIFKLDSVGNFTTLYYFTNGVDGAAPNAGLVIGPGGNLYGTTAAGGAYGMGTIFEISSNGGFTALYSFAGANDGSTPVAPLVFGTDANLYGTTEFGGASDSGTAFEVVLPTLTAPSFTSIVPGSGLISLTWSTVPGQVYQLQVSADLAKNTWVNLGNPASGTAGPATLLGFVDTNVGNVQRYYRVTSYAQ